MSLNSTFIFLQMVDEEEELPDDFHGEMIPEIVVDPSESRDLSYLHITVPRIDSIFEKNKKVYLSESNSSSFLLVSIDFHDSLILFLSPWPVLSEISKADLSFLSASTFCLCPPHDCCFPSPCMSFNISFWPRMFASLFMSLSSLSRFMYLLLL